jgi:hypothetical protein
MLINYCGNILIILLKKYSKRNSPTTSGIVLKVCIYIYMLGFFAGFVFSWIKQVIKDAGY